MASRATQQRKKPLSYANAVKGVEEKNDFFTLAKCNLKRQDHMPNGRIPNTTEAYSFFVDLKSTNATNSEVLNAINTAGIVGANVRDDLWVIEFVCENENAVEIAMNTVFTVEGKTPFMAITPRHKTNKTLLIKIANVPFGPEHELRIALTHYWTTLGKVIDVQPYKFPGRPWLTKRWDILLQLPDNEKKLNAPPVFRLYGYSDTFICSWNGAKKACLVCKNAGHSSSKCPTKKPKIQKVGELANPLQKIGGVGQDQKRKDKGSEKVPGNSGKTPASSSSTASATTQATPASPATVAQQIQAPSGTFTVAVPPTTVTPVSAATGSTSASVFGRPRVITTPPPSTLPDPDTPKKGNKRMSKDEDAFTPTIEQLRGYVIGNNICLKCCEIGHSERACPDKKSRPISLHILASTEKFRPHMEAWAHARRKRGDSWRFYDVRTSGPYNPVICSRCHHEGHGKEECKANLKCNHCDGDHLGVDCPEKPTYAYEAMDIRQ
jgi:hypothetical protein